MDWLEQLEREIGRRLGPRVYQGADSLAQARRDQTSAYQAARTQPVSGAAPRRTDFVSVREDPATRKTFQGIKGTLFDQTGSTSRTAAGRPQLQFDEASYIDAQFGWMRGQERYGDWSDDDIRQFLTSTANMPDGQRAAAELWESNRIATDQAQKEARADRDRMLAELATFREGFNERWISTAIAQESAAWDAKITGTIKRVTEQYSAMGRVASPFLIGELNRRLTAQKMDALQIRRVELENERDQKMTNYLGMLNNVLANTQRQVMDPATAAALAQQLGSSDSPVTAAKA